MIVLKGTIQHGEVVLPRPADLADGTHVAVLPLSETPPALGMREEDWPTTPEGIAALVARMDALEPGWLSPEDEAAWKADLKAQKEAEKARFFEHAEKLRRMWE